MEFGSLLGGVCVCGDSAERTFEMQLLQMEETTKSQEPWKQPLSSISNIADSMEAEFVYGDLMKKPSPRARELLDQAISTNGSPPKKLKTT
jgi:hypothetical protein